MPHLGWSFGLLPLACGCPTCDSTIVCFLIAATLAATIVAGIAIVQELQLLGNFREM
jgi:hypothetical protein